MGGGGAQALELSELLAEGDREGGLAAFWVMAILPAFPETISVD